MIVSASLVIELPTHLIDFCIEAEIMFEITEMISMKSNDFEILYTIFASVEPLEYGPFLYIRS